jgi:CHASE2 domain-containing sensor protein
MAVLIFHEETRFESEKNCPGEEIPRSQLFSADYKLVTSFSSFHDPNDQLVRIVTLVGGTEPEEVLSSDVCVQREFLAKLVRKLKLSGSSIIVIDKRFSDSTCANQTKGTDDLIKAVAEGGSRVVIGLGTSFVPRSQWKTLGTRVTCMTADSTVKFKEAKLGLIRIDSDTRRVALDWPVFADAKEPPKLMPTLALLAAEEVNPNVTRRKRLASILNSGKPPFSFFNPRNTFNKYSALALLCGTAATPSTPWRNCTEAPDTLSTELQGKIAVIGEYSSSDEHETVLGSMYGVDLQANYIAALLSDDVYIAVGDSLSNTLYATFWFLVVQGIFAFVRPLPRAAVFCGILWAAIFITSVLLLTYWGRLITFWFQGLNLGIILLTWVEYWLHGMSVHHK